MEYLLSHFKNRQELDRAMANRIEEDDDLIVGTLEQITSFQLTEEKKVHGVSVSRESKKEEVKTRIKNKVDSKKTIISKQR